MTQQDPEKRLTVNEYRKILEGSLSDTKLQDSSAWHFTNDTKASVVFPAYFDSTLYPLFEEMHWSGSTPDDRISILCQVLY